MRGRSVFVARPGLGIDKWRVEPRRGVRCVVMSDVDVGGDVGSNDKTNMLKTHWNSFLESKARQENRLSQRTGHEFQLPCSKQHAQSTVQHVYM